MSDNRDANIAALVALGAAPTEAEGILDAANGDLQVAADLFLDQAGAAREGGDSDMVDTAADEPANNLPQSVPGGGRTLGGAYVPPTEASSSSASSTQRTVGQQQRGVAGLRTLKDLQGGGAAGGHGHAHGDDSDDDDDHPEQDFFAGGEKSGLAVQNPNSQPRSAQDHINNLLKRARENAPRPGGDDEPQPTSAFRGAGTTLGGEGTESRTIPDPNANARAPAQRVRRELHLWRDGFSVDDGALFRYDDPNNAHTLQMIHAGHAPLHILNVEPGQEVDVEVHPHKDEDYKQPKKKYIPFGGSGQRLGSPAPGASAAAAAPAPAAAGSSSASASATAGTAQPTVDVDTSAPMVTLQIRLGDGSRLQSRFNTTHTVGDVYNFVDQSSSDGREYALMTTFPSKELTDKAQALGDMAEFKRGGVVVQKWK